MCEIPPGSFRPDSPGKVSLMGVAGVQNYIYIIKQRGYSNWDWVFERGSHLLAREKKERYLKLGSLGIINENIPAFSYVSVQCYE